MALQLVMQSLYFYFHTINNWKIEIDIDILGLYLFMAYVDLCNHIINKQKLFKIYYYSYLSLAVRIWGVILFFIAKSSI